MSYRPSWVGTLLGSLLVLAAFASEARAICCGVTCCFIDGLCRATGARNPANICQLCDPTLSQTLWSTDNTTTECDDGNPCTLGDSCSGATCTPGAPRNCTSLDTACTVGTCNTGTGACQSQPTNNGGACNDGDACTDNDVCSSGACAGSAKNCSAMDGMCAVGVCNGSGNCVAQPVGDGASCEDGQTCTVGDSCQSGICLSGPDNCNDAGELEDAGSEQSGAGGDGSGGSGGSAGRSSAGSGGTGGRGTAGSAAQSGSGGAAGRSGAAGRAGSGSGAGRDASVDAGDDSAAGGDDDCHCSIAGRERTPSTGLGVALGLCVLWRLRRRWR